MPLWSIGHAFSALQRVHLLSIASCAAVLIGSAALLRRARRRAECLVRAEDCAPAVLRLRGHRCRPLPASERTVPRRVMRWLGWMPLSDTVVVLRTAEPADAELYHTLLLPLQRQLRPSFELVVETDSSCSDAVYIAVRTRDFCSSSNSRDAGGAALTLCRIPLPDDRVYRHIPPAVPRIIAAHTMNRRLFGSFAQELSFYAPYLKEFQEYKKSCAVPVAPRLSAQSSVSAMPLTQREMSTRTTSPRRAMPTSLSAASPVGVSASNALALSSGALEVPAEHSAALRHAPPQPRRCEEEDASSSVMCALLGYMVDANATAFSSSMLAEYGDVSLASSLVCAAKEDQFMYETLHEACFHVVFHTPLSRPDMSAVDMLAQHPYELWRACRRSRKAAAELYIIDVVSAKGDAMICHKRVVDEVVAQAVIVHHRGSLLEFADALKELFGFVYVPVTTVMRRIFERSRRSASHGENGGIHASESFLSSEGDLKGEDLCELKYKKAEEEEEDDNNDYNEEEEEDVETTAHIFMELPHVCDFLIMHRLDFSSAMLTASGSNKLEEVFGTPATVFPFLLCACESVAFVTQAFECIVSAYGPLNYNNFASYAHDVFVRDRPEIVRHAPRIFRALNKSRTGVISFEEICGWMARKLSSGLQTKPDAHLLAAAMSLRLPLALLLDRRHKWPLLECALPSLSDGEEETY